MINYLYTVTGIIKLIRGVTSLKKLIFSDNVKYSIFILLGSLLSAISINMFLTHANLLSGGISGIAVLIQYLTNFPAGYTIFIANIPLLILSYRKLNLRFTILSIIGTVSFSAFLVITKDLKSILDVNDILLYCLYGGILNGAGVGITYANHGSAGGFSIITMVIKKKYDNLDVGQINFIINCIIVFLGALTFGLPSALYTLISMYVTSMVTDKIINGLSRKKVLFIITNKEKQVFHYIKSNFLRGATILNGEGVYSKEERKVIYCVVSLSRLPEFKLSIQSIDKDALVTVMEASEVNGKGFSTSIL